MDTAQPITSPESPAGSTGAPAGSAGAATETCYFCGALMVPKARKCTAPGCGKLQPSKAIREKLDADERTRAAAARPVVSDKPLKGVYRVAKGFSCQLGPQFRTFAEGQMIDDPLLIKELKHQGQPLEKVGSSVKMITCPCGCGHSFPLDLETLKAPTDDA